jgi:hypothetical protein
MYVNSDYHLMFVLGRPTAYHHTGDEAVCSTYLPFARKKLESLFKRTPEMCRRQTFPLDGVDITIIAANTVGQIIISAGTEYLDTGFYDHRSIAPLNPDAFLPSHLYYAAPQVGGLVQGKLSIKGGIASGAVVLPERDSIVMGGTTLVKTAPNGATSPTAIYSSDIELLNRKYLQVAVPSSNYCGLTALYVQCLYGSKTTQNQYYAHNAAPGIGIDPTSGPPVPVILAGDFHFFLLYIGANAPWVVCKNWKYWFVTINSNKTVSFRRINTVLSNSAPQTGDLKTHAAMLAGSRLAGTDRVFPCNTTLTGVPLAYAWKTNALGDTARIILHDALGDGSFNARHYEAVVQFDAAGTPNGVAVSLLQQAKWAVTNSSHCLYLPDYFSHTDIGLKGVGVYGCNAPIYETAFGGTFKTLNIIGPDSTAGISGIGGFSGGITAAEIYSSWTATSSAGEDVHYGGNGIPDDPEEFYGSDALWHIAGTYNPGYASDSRVVDPPPDSTGFWEQRIIRITSEQWSTAYLWRGGVSVSYRPLLLIPFGDCNATLSGYSTATGWSSATEFTGAPGFPKIASFQHRFHAYGEPVGSWDDAGELVWNSAGASGSWSGTHGEGNSAYINSGYLYYYHDDPINSGPGSSGGSSVEFLTIANGSTTIPVSAAYFQPELGVAGDPTIPAAEVKSSLGGSYIYTLSFSEAGSHGWPLHTSNPVGWA